MSKDNNRLYEVGRYRLDAGNRALLRDGQAVPLPPKAVELLAALVERNGQVVSKEQLMSLLSPATIRRTSKPAGSMPKAATSGAGGTSRG